MRHRICNYREEWRNAGVSLTLKPFLTAGLYLRRRQFGWRATLYKAATLAFCTMRLMLRLMTISRYDVVIVHREVFPLGGAFFERFAARLNPCIVFDLDDALWIPMPLAINQRKLFWDANRVAHTMSACRAVVAGNDYLAAYSRQFNPCVQVIPTPYVDLGGSAGVVAERGGPPIIVWIGNAGNEDYLEMLRNPLQRLSREQEFVLRVIGSSEISRFHLNGVRIEAFEWREDKERAWLLECAIGIMPLVDREYERGKCAFKIVQYFSAGMPVVASAVGMNCEVVEHGRNGYLVKSDDEWYIALKALLENPQRRREMGTHGYSLYRRRFTPGRNAELWLGVFDRVLSGSPSR